MEFKKLVPLVVVGVLLHQQPHSAHSQYAGRPMMVGGGAEVMFVTATAATMLIFSK
jgi:hypothetical protein